MAVRADAALQAQWKKGGFGEALTAQGVRLRQRVVFVDELRVGLIGQVRRRWTARGVK